MKPTLTFLRHLISHSPLASTPLIPAHWSILDNIDTMVNPCPHVCVLTSVVCLATTRGNDKRFSCSGRAVHILQLLLPSFGHSEEEEGRGRESRRGGRDGLRVEIGRDMKESERRRERERERLSLPRWELWCRIWIVSQECKARATHANSTNSTVAWTFIYNILRLLQCVSLREVAGTAVRPCVGVSQFMQQPPSMETHLRGYRSLRGVRELLFKVNLCITHVDRLETTTAAACVGRTGFRASEGVARCNFPCPVHSRTRGNEAGI